MRGFFFVVAACLVAAALTAPVAAQDAGNGTAVELQQSEDDDRVDCADGELIDRTLKLCDRRWQDGTAVVVLESDRSQAIDVRDMGSYMTPGDPVSRSLHVPEGQFAVRMELTTYEREAGLAVDTSRSYYPVLFSEKFELIGGSWDYRDAQLAVIGALISSLLVIVPGVLLSKRGTFEKPELIR